MKYEGSWVLFTKSWSSLNRVVTKSSLGVFEFLPFYFILKTSDWLITQVRSQSEVSKKTVCQNKSFLKKYFQNLQHYTVSHEPFKYEKSKKILLLNPLHKKDKNWGMETGNEEFQRRNCRVKNCYITSKRQLLGFSNKLSINFFLKKFSILWHPNFFSP